MSASSTILNEIQAQIVKFGKIENLKNFTIPIRNAGNCLKECSPATDR